MGKLNWPWQSPLRMILLVFTTPSLSLTASTPPLPPPPRSPPPPPSSTLKPSMAVIVGVLTTMFSLTFLLLLYAKHCRRTHPPVVTVVSTDRKNSGVDRTIIELLPVFRFGSLSGEKEGLECAVCLTRFEPSEVLRLLPKCKHAFHVGCVDTWLDSHSTCPLCRYRVEPEDILLLVDESQHQVREEKEAAVRPVSGRHSSAGEKGSGLLQISVDKSGSRRSLDSKRKKAETSHRKDGLLLAAEEEEKRRRRCEHRIIIGAQRWSDVQPSDDVLYLRSEMILSEGRSRLKGSRPSLWQQSGRSAINGRSVSEITGLSRFRSNDEAGVC